MPIDPESDGTWIAMNDAGLVATMLNANAPGGSPRRTWDGLGDSSMGLQVSRGAIIPQLMACSDVGVIERVLQRLNPRLYSPFRLLATDGVTLLIAGRERDSVIVTTATWDDQPVMLTSSGLGDAVVEPPRRGLFRQMFDCDPRQWPNVQDQFHRHRFPGQPHVSVNMSRADARTVSHTVIERDGDRVMMAYYDDAPDDAAASVARVELVLHLSAEAPR